MYYDGVKTITTMFTNVFLISNRLYDLYEISKISVFGDQKAISTSTMVYACYNNVKMYLEADFKKHIIMIYYNILKWRMN